MVVTGNVADFVDLVTSLTSSKIIIVILFCLMYIILGALIDTTSMMIITLPFVFPVIEHFQINPIWFGIIFVKVIELSVISPPVGLNLYAVLSGAGGMVNSKALFLGVIPFMIMDILTLILLLAFPQIALWLPTTMGH